MHRCLFWLYCFPLRACSCYNHAPCIINTGPRSAMPSEHLPTTIPNSEQESLSRQPPQVFGSAGPPEDIARLRDRINRALSRHLPMPDFPKARIPAATFNPSVHAAMTDLVQQRDRCDDALHRMVHDEAADGTPLDPKRNYEPEYETCSERLNECNRQLYTIYSRYLDRPSRPLLLQPEASVQQPSDSA